jgi:hypothetical protein
MFKRMCVSAAVFGLLSFPAFANCEQELSKLKDAVTTSETGATTEQSGVPATKHQEEVLSGDKAETAATDTTGSTGTAVEAVSPHQKAVTGMKGSTDAAHPSDMMKEAGDLAKSGDEAGCMTKVEQLKTMIGETD